MAHNELARRYLVRGRVQGVGYRYFVQKHAIELGVRGSVRNLEDGNVEVFAIGSHPQLTRLESVLRQGPAWSEVRSVDVSEAAPQRFSSFQIEG